MSTRFQDGAHLPSGMLGVGVPGLFYGFVAAVFAKATSKVLENALRREGGDSVNLFWPNLAHWRGMLWDRA